MSKVVSSIQSGVPQVLLLRNSVLLGSAHEAHVWKKSRPQAFEMVVVYECKSVFLQGHVTGKPLWFLMILS